MKILIYGECGDYGTGAWCYAQTLIQMGHDVQWFHPYTGVEKYLHSLFWKVIRKFNQRNILKKHLEYHNKLFIEKAHVHQPEIIIILKGLFIPGHTIVELKKMGAWVVNINHDDFFSLNPNNRSEVQLNAIPFYHHIFTTREVNVKELLPYNKNTTFFPFAYYPKIHRIIDLPESESNFWRNDVLFVGTWEKERAKLLEKLVIEVPADYAIYGTQWQKVSKSSPLYPYLKFKPLIGDEMAIAIRYAKMSLGFLRKENRDDYTQRTFEIPACGGLLLAERTDRHKEFYREGVEAVFFDAGSEKDLIEQVKGLLHSSGKCEEIKKAGYERLLTDGHTYKHRLTKLIDFYEKR